MSQPKYQSSEHEAYSRWRNHDMSDVEFRATMGMLISQKAFLHQPMRLPWMAESLLAYVNARHNSARERDSDFHRKLTEWVLTYSEANHENMVRFRVLQWAEQNLLAVGATSDVERASEMIDRFAHIKQAPVEIFEKAVHVLARDTVERGSA